MLDQPPSGTSTSELWESIAPRMNDDLIALQRILEDRAASDDSLRPPLVHIIGPPRSGTTLALQVLSSSLDIGYITNTAAAFWRAPAVGVILSRHLHQRDRASGFESEYGRTQGPQEPHEFGRFWLELLGYRSMTHGDRVHVPIDWDHVRKTLMSITWAWQAPVAVKTFVGVWHLADLMAAVPGSIAVRVRRDPVDTTLSLLRMREARLGSQPGWVSVVPRACLTAGLTTPIEQVACQVVSFESEIDQGLVPIQRERIIEVTYADLVSSPSRFTSSVQRALQSLSCPVSRMATPTLSPRPSPVRDERRAAVESIIERLHAESSTPGAR